MKTKLKNFVMALRSSLFAGIYIGTAGFGFLTATTQTQYGSLAGAVLFALGLLAIVGYKLKLYTGTAGFIDKDEIGNLMTILLGNIGGCFLMATLTNYSPIADGIHQVAANILNSRLQVGFFGCGVLAIGCGLLMTTAVNFARQQNFLPLLFSVPLFIVCGFPHCIADAFYYLTVTDLWTTELIGVYICTVVGNAIGCNLYRIILAKEQY